MALVAGSRLGPYEVLSPIGAGGMGEVYRARDPRLAREVALKVLPPDHAADPERLRRFEQEARAVAALNHPHILAVFDVGSEGGVSYVVFELLEGETLRRKLERGPLPARKAVEYAVQIWSDLFALGAILYEMLLGKRAFAGETAADTLSAILHQEPPEIASAEGPIPAGLERVVRRCLEKDPEERFQSARDVAFALEALTGPTGGVAWPT